MFFAAKAQLHNSTPANGRCGQVQQQARAQNGFDHLPNQACWSQVSAEGRAVWCRGKSNAAVLGIAGTISPRLAPRLPLRCKRQQKSCFAIGTVLVKFPNCKEGTACDAISDDNSVCQLAKATTNWKTFQEKSIVCYSVHEHPGPVVRCQARRPLLRRLIAFWDVGRSERILGRVVRVMLFASHALLLIKSRVKDTGPAEVIKGVVDLGFCVAGATVHFNVRSVGAGVIAVMFPPRRTLACTRWHVPRFSRVCKKVG